MVGVVKIIANAFDFCQVGSANARPNFSSEKSWLTFKGRSMLKFSHFLLRKSAGMLNVWLFGV